MGKRMLGISSGKYPGDGFDIGHTFALRTFGSSFYVGFNRFFLFGSGDLRHQFVLGCQRHKRYPKYSIRSCSENRNSAFCIFQSKIY